MLKRIIAKSRSMVFLFRSAVFTVGWVALDRMPESRITPDFLMAPLRYVWSALYMHKNFFAGSAYGLLWCSLAGLLLDKTFVVACDALLQKPFTPSDIQRRVRELLDTAQRAT